jgi:hypothetical protein
MLRKTLIALTAAAALGVSSGAVTAHGHGSRGATGSSSVPMHYSGSNGGVSTQSHVTTMGPGSGTWKGANWNGGQWRHHHRHNRFFFGAGFAGPFYGYGYDSCWRLAQTYYGWQRVWVCGDYPYWGY